MAKEMASASDTQGRPPPSKVSTSTATRRQPDGGDLQAAQLLAEQHGAHGDDDQRVDVVAERGLDGAVGGDRPDIDAPVDGDQRGGERRHQQRARRPEAPP